MKFSVFVAIVALLGLSVDAAKLSQSSVGARGDDDDETQFSKFVSKFQRSYKTKSEFNKRLSNFKKNKKIVEEHNAKNEGFELETNKLADLSDNEYQSMFGLIAPTDDDSNNNAQFLGYEGEELAEQTVPTSVNWVTAGAVQSIRNQASCGSCYAFSALSTIESALWIKSKTTVNLSEQQVVDCSGSYGNQGCGGGWMSYVYNYVKAKKVATEA
jgi:cathepsin L